MIVLARGKLNDWTLSSHDVGDVSSSDVADDRTQRASSRWMDEGDGASASRAALRYART
jgi:hypothetical protein